MRNWMPDALIKQKYHFVLTRTFKVNNFEFFFFNIYGILKQGNGMKLHVIMEWTNDRSDRRFPWFKAPTWKPFRLLRIFIEFLKDLIYKMTMLKFIKSFLVQFFLLHAKTCKKKLMKYLEFIYFFYLFACWSLSATKSYKLEMLDHPKMNKKRQ